MYKDLTYDLPGMPPGQKGNIAIPHNTIESQFRPKPGAGQSHAFFILHPIRNLTYSDAHH